MDELSQLSHVKSSASAVDHVARHDIEEIKQRNARVEADKAWETSTTRKVLVAVLTYIVVVLFFVVANLPKPFINALVPTMGFLLSTLSVGYAKRVWVKRQYKE